MRELTRTRSDGRTETLSAWTEDWEAALDLAQAYYWVPDGTLPPPDDVRIDLSAAWEGERLIEHDPSDYRSSNWQLVGTDDGIRLAAALENALLDIPKHADAAAGKPVRGDLAKEVVGGSMCANPLEAFAGPHARKRLADIILFAGRGAFSIR